MSTASRDCGRTGGARDGKRNALSAPGVNGKPRGHYDPRAERQLGLPQKGSTEARTGISKRRVRKPGASAHFIYIFCAAPAPARTFPSPFQAGPS
jgi:hypothetical protein